MKGVTVLDFPEKISTNLKAESAKFDKKNSSWIFLNGSMVSIDRSGQTGILNLKDTYIHS